MSMMGVTLGSIFKAAFEEVEEFALKHLMILPTIEVIVSRILRNLSQLYGCPTSYFSLFT